MKKIALLLFFGVAGGLITEAIAGPRSTSEDLMSQLNINPLMTRRGDGRATAMLRMPDSLANSDVALSITATGPSLVYNDPETLADAFAFSKTLNAIAQGAETETTAADLIGSLIDSHSLSSAENVDAVDNEGNGPLSIPIQQRTLESNMDHQATVDGLVPVGLFNRFDTAPTDGSHCGEYRIVYAIPRTDSDEKHSSLTKGGGRFFIIFEAAIPNPLKEEGILGCLPIAQFWQSLESGNSVQELSAEEKQEIVNQLEQFYYRGIEATYFGQPVTIGPVVKFEHYQAPLGQVRTNEFLTGRWQLREFRTGLDKDGKAEFKIETVKNNALAEYYDAENKFNHGGSDNIDVFKNLRTEYHNLFVSEKVQELTAADRNVNNKNVFINQIGLHIPNRFNEFQSDAQGRADAVSDLADAELQASITNVLTEINDRLGRSGLDGNLITQEHIFARAQVATCGGCHQLSNGQVVGVNNNGTDITWPRSATFVHILENGTLSGALTNNFLPARKAVLEGFLKNAPSTKFEINQITTDNTIGVGKDEDKWTTVSFSQSYDTDTPAVFINAGARGSDPCHTRVKNITKTGFDTQCVEVFENGGHLDMKADYLAFNTGISKLGSNQTVETQCLDINQVQGRDRGVKPTGWQPVTFSAHFSQPPVILSQIITDNNQALDDASTIAKTWLTVAVKDVTRNGFMAALDVSKTSSNQQDISAEKVCFAAIQKGDFKIATESTIPVNCKADTMEVRGWRDSCEFSGELSGFNDSLHIVGGKQDRNGIDGGWLRRKCDSNVSQGVSFVVDEDKTERRHTSETAGYLVCDQAIHTN